MKRIKLDFKQLLSLSIVYLTFGIIYMLFFVEPPEANRENIIMAIGVVLGQGLSSVVKFHLNSNDQSEKKTQIIAEMKANQKEEVKT